MVWYKGSVIFLNGDLEDVSSGGGVMHLFFIGIKVET